MKIGAVLDRKANRDLGLVVVAADASLMDAARLLCKHNIGALLVTDPKGGGGHVGILSERDIIRRCAEGAKLDGIKVSDAMSRKVLVVTAEDDVDVASGIMARHHIRHLPVVDSGKVVGMITVRDVVEALDEQKDIHIRHLGDVVGGTYGSEVF